MDTAKTENSPPNGTAADLRCVNCGAKFTPSRSWSNFCKTGCRQQFHARMSKEGGPVIAFVKAWIDTRHAIEGSPNAAIRSYAFTELTALATRLIKADKEAGRPSASLYVERLRDGDLSREDRFDRCKAELPLVPCSGPSCHVRKRTAQREFLCKTHAKHVLKPDREKMAEFRAKAHNGYISWDEYDQAWRDMITRTMGHLAT